MMCNGECGHYYCGYCFKEIGTEVNVAHAHVMECGGSYYGRGGDNALGIHNQAVTDQEHEIAVKKAKEIRLVKWVIQQQAECKEETLDLLLRMSDDVSRAGMDPNKYIDMFER